MNLPFLPVGLDVVEALAEALLVVDICDNCLRWQRPLVRRFDVIDVMPWDVVSAHLHGHLNDSYPVYRLSNIELSAEGPL